MAAHALSSTGCSPRTSRVVRSATTPGTHDLLALLDYRIRITRFALSVLRSVTFVLLLLPLTDFLCAGLPAGVIH